MNSCMALRFISVWLFFFRCVETIARKSIDNVLTTLEVGCQFLVSINPVIQSECLKTVQ